MPAKQSREPHDHAADRDHQRKIVEPRLVGQGREREKRDGERNQRIGEIELIVAVVQASYVF